jgi:hypothetical protein
MQTLPSSVNPFALMLDPQAVLAQIEHSERLERLSRRICRPLDKPMLGAASEGDTAADGSAEDAEGGGADTSSLGTDQGMTAPGRGA